MAASISGLHARARGPFTPSAHDPDGDSRAYAGHNAVRVGPCPSERSCSAASAWFVREASRTGLEGVSRHRKRTTTVRDPQAGSAEDLVDRDFSASGPNELWVADITYVSTFVGHLYLAVALDAWNRRSWAGRCKTTYAPSWCSMPSTWPSPDVSPTKSSTIRTRAASTRRWPSARVAPSWDTAVDAMCESFFATLECELLDCVRFRNHTEADAAVFDFIDGFYNPRRRHSALEYLSPARYERIHAQGA